MARKSREVSGTGIYHVMMRGTNRQDIFEDGYDYLRFLGILRNMVYPVNDTGKPLPQRCHFCNRGTGTEVNPKVWTD